MKATRFIVITIALFVTLSLTACGGDNTDGTAVIFGTAAINYSQTTNWLTLTTAPLKNVDVFYVYPTAYNRLSDSDPYFCSINNASMVQGAKSAFQRQATAFAPYANIYAPYYRQVDATYQLGLSIDQQDTNIRKVPGPDVTAAFDYYIKHYNKGRPFILAGHSQGSAVLKYLLSDYMSAYPDVYKRMIAAYVVGQSITSQYLAANPHLKYATGGSDTGVLISWNTEATDIASPNPVTQPGGIAINPITWMRGTVTATASQNLGSIQLDPNTDLPVLDQYGDILRVPGLADATVSTTRGVVICSTVTASDYNFGFPLGVYHTFDYPFYFFNVRQNAADRIQQYFIENP
jgi:hypothetical protein